MNRAKELLQVCLEGKLNDIANPHLEKKYGFKNFGELGQYLKSDPGWQSTIKKEGIFGIAAFGGADDFKVILVGKEGMITLAKSGNGLVGSRSVAVFPLSDLD